MAMGNIVLTARDYDVLRALELCPFTVRQLRAISVTFSAPFSSDRRLQDRLCQLANAGILNRFRYFIPGSLGQYYYTLTPESFCILHGQDAPLPSSGFFREVGMARHHHMHGLSDFIVHTFVAAHLASVAVCEFTRENALKLSVAGDELFPDGSFVLMQAGKPPFLFYIELDNSTEPLASPKTRDSWLQKLRFYEKLQNDSASRFRVLGIVTRSKKRLENIAALAASVATNPQRSLFYGVHLPDYLADPTPLSTALFTDHRGLKVSLLPKTNHSEGMPAQMAERTLAEIVAV